MNARQKEIYELCRRLRPTVGGLGAAYRLGLASPLLPVNEAGPMVGLPGSEARAAYLAGQHDARATSSGNVQREKEK
jgi:hypothetical protein